MDLVDAEAAVLAAKHELWRRGDLAWKLDKTQKKMYDAIQRGRRKHCLLCSRRLGKSFLLVVVAFETALKKPNQRISYAAPFGRDASDIATDLAVEIMLDCPEDIRPEYRAATKEYVFKNGSVIRFAGLNSEHAQQLRGRKAHLFIIDEMGLCDDVKHVIQDVAMPMTLTTGGRMIFATTPARSPGHDSSIIIKKMLADGEVSTFTILDNHRVGNDVKAEYLIEAGERPEAIPEILAGLRLPESTTALREYFVQLDITDAETAVIPEFTAQAQKDIVFDIERPPFFDSYVCVDPGSVDNTGILYAYWHFLEKKLVIEAESLLKRPSTHDIARAIQTQEAALWGVKPPLTRISDIDPRLVMDLWQNYGLSFKQANRQDAFGAIDNVRTMIRRREIIIAPSCTSLIRQLKNATWNRKATDFERTQEDAHFDLLAALKYLAREIVKGKNPFPSWYYDPGFGHSNGPDRAKPKTVFSDTPLGRKLAKKWG